DAGPLQGPDRGGRDFASYYGGGGEKVPNSQFEDRFIRLVAGFKSSDFHDVKVNLQLHRADDAGFDPLLDQPRGFVGMTVVAHLGHDPRLARRPIP
ncbi:MAG: hypothetical protein ACO377_11380, partial [Pseudomonadales bacterium]